MPIIPDEKSKVTPSVFQAIMLDEIANGIRELTSLIKETIPEGIIETYNLTATTNMQEIRPPAGKRWFSVQIFNEGPNTVKIGINTTITETKDVKSGDSYNINFGVGKIQYIKYKTTTGTSKIIISAIR